MQKKIKKKFAQTGRMREDMMRIAAKYAENADLCNHLTKSREKQFLEQFYSNNDDGYDHNKEGKNHHKLRNCELLGFVFFICVFFSVCK